jgi:GAF domain-containing protein
MAGKSIESTAAALERETTVQGLLETACRELVEALDGKACAISRVVGDLLVLLVQYRPGDERLDLGHEYLISEYPLTAEAIALGEPRTVSVLDDAPDEKEAALLQRLGFESLLMVCLPVTGGCWGLIEVYGEGSAFDEQQAALAEQVSALVGARLDTLEAD